MRFPPQQLNNAHVVKSNSARARLGRLTRGDRLPDVSVHVKGDPAAMKAATPGAHVSGLQHSSIRVFVCSVGVTLTKWRDGNDGQVPPMSWLSDWASVEVREDLARRGPDAVFLAVPDRVCTKLRDSRDFAKKCRGVSHKR